MADFSTRGSVSVAPYVTVGKDAAAIESGLGWLPQQALVVAICFLLNMLDGMDVLILSYIAPTLSKDWGVTPDRLGVLFSAGLAGMAVGGLFIAPLADRWGRRYLILFSIALMSVATLASSFAGDITHLIGLRFLVGIGIGTVLASMAALTAEYAPPRHRVFAVSFLQAGYPVGAVLTGFLVAHHIEALGWRGMLFWAGIASAVTVPLIFFCLPESLEFLIKRQPKGALTKINALRRRFGELPLEILPETVVATKNEVGVRGLFADGRGLPTVLIWLAISLCFMTLYFVISWIPKLSIQAGLATSDAIYAGAAYNVGAFVGMTSIGMFPAKVDLRKLILAYLLAGAAALIVFGSVHMPVSGTLFVAFLIGVTVQGGFNGFYPFAATLYPAAVRSTGIGWAMGIGRIGAVLGPMLGGWLLAAKLPLPVIFAVFAVPMVLAGLCAVLNPARPQVTEIAPAVMEASEDPAALPHSVLAGLIGRGITGSRSPRMQEYEARAQGIGMVYRTIDLGHRGDFRRNGGDKADIGDVLTGLERAGFDGVNVARHYRQSVIPHLQDLDACAQRLGAVNTILFRNGRRIGRNTDADSFIASFKAGLPGADLSHVVILGAGSVGTAVASALLDMGARRLTIVDPDAACVAALATRLDTPAIDTQPLAEALVTATGLVQCSPAGMEHQPALPMDPALLRPEMWVNELVYFPLETAFLKAARARGCRTLGGGGMAIQRAAISFSLFTGHEANLSRLASGFALKA
ncbi:MAG: shikimate dehydrogenase [Asticcacaulis sp.]|uniref:shikimate dehydrogenase n=1 Tax=Asticcacaulis sp. TaxID=1872648 RepID=UPI0039E60645